MAGRTFDPDSLTDAVLGITEIALQTTEQASPRQDATSERLRETLRDRFRFNPRGEPTALSKFVLLRRDLSSRPLLRRIMRRKNGTIRLDWRDWFDAVVDAEVSRTSRELNLSASYFMSRRIHLHSRTLHIVTTKHTEFLGEMIENSLAGTRFTITRSTEMPRDFPHDLYIVAAPQIFDRLPPQYKRIVFQLEQSGVSHWFTPAYLRSLNSSLAIFDYSLENIDYLLKNGSAFKSIFHLPIRPTELRREGKDRDIDVLFYGALGKSRRREILAELGKHHNVRIESNLFGEALADLLDRAKVVVNIHFYDGALLETTRIAQALSHGARVVSEVAEDQHRNGYYEGPVDFVPVGDVQAMADAITRVLKDWAEPAIHDHPDQEALDGTRFMLLRALMACGVISFQELWQACSTMTLPGDRIVLGMPESLERHDFALQRRLEGAELFPGLRLTAGWMGCALSYKFLAMLAVQEDRPKLTIYEDDADFGADGHRRFARVESYLESHPADWDIFSGLLSDLHEDAQVTAVYDFGDEQIVEVDRVIGMVFGTYDRKALDRIADFHFAGNDTNKHTIDRYLESFQMKVLSLVRPLVDHHDDLSSTIWKADNRRITDLIATSRLRLEQKAREFQKAAKG